MRRSNFALGFILMIAAGLPAAADEKPAEKPSAEQPAPLEVKGTFEAGKTAEISLVSQAWTTWVTTKAARHGMAVKKLYELYWQKVQT